MEEILLNKLPFGNFHPDKKSKETNKMTIQIIKPTIKQILTLILEIILI